MAFFYEGDTINEIFNKIYHSFETSKNITIPSQRGDNIEKLHSIISLHNPQQRWLTIRKPSISLAYVFAELIILLSGNNEAKIINSWNPSLPKFQGDYQKYPGSYGNRLKYQFGFDQLEKAYSALLHEPSSRQIVLSIWKPDLDLPKTQGIPNSMDIPCNVISMLKIRDNKLHWSQIMRSNDFYLGLPYDVILFSLLQEVFAGWLKIELGEYSHFCDSLHYYVNKKMNIAETDDSTFQIEDLRLEKSEYDKTFPILYNYFTSLSDNEKVENEVEMIINSPITLPKSYDNILMILCLYKSFKETRNSNHFDICMKRCSNELYKSLFINWMSEQKKDKE